MKSLEKLFQNSTKCTSYIDKFTKLPDYSNNDNIRTKKLEFRSSYIIKFMKNLEIFTKFQKTSNLLRIDKQNLFLDLIKKIINTLNFQKNILFHENMLYNN